jgi:hypothetical protein
VMLAQASANAKSTKARTATTHRRLLIADLLSDPFVRFNGGLLSLGETY